MSKFWICAGCGICLVPFVVILAIAICVDFTRAPKCYIQELYVPALDLSLESTTFSNSSNTSTGRPIINPSLFLDLAMRNGKSEQHVLYGDIKLTFTYGQSHKIIANHVIPSFFQDDKDTAYRRQVVETHGVPWGDALREVSNGSKVVFRVELVAKPQLIFFDDDSTYKKQKDMSIGADVEVDGSGMKVQRGYVRLVNSAGPEGRVGVSLIVVLLLLLIF